MFIPLVFAVNIANPPYLLQIVNGTIIEQGGNGTVTSVTAGTGLTGGIITSYGTIGIDNNYIQQFNESAAVSALQTLSVALYNNLSSVGNWTADKPNYATKSYVLGMGNWSANASLYTTKTVADTLYYPLSSNPAGYLTSYTETDPVYVAARSMIYLNLTTIGNWSADKSAYNTTATLNTWFYPLQSNPYGYYNSSTLPSGFTLAQIAANIGNWSADKSAYNTTAQLQNIFAPIGTGGNTSWNETYANTLYYPLVANPNGYYNSSTLPATDFSEIYANITALQSSNTTTNARIDGVVSNLANVNNSKLNISDQRYNETAYIQSQIGGLNNVSLSTIQSRINANGNWSADQSGYVAKSTRINATGPIFVNGTTFTSIGQGFTISISQAGGVTGGFLSAVDWNTFNDKMNTSDQRYNETAYIQSQINGLNNISLSTIQSRIDANGNWSADKSGIYNNISARLVDVVSANNYITTAGTTNKTLTFQEAVLNQTIEDFVATTTYNATSIVTVRGTPSSSSSLAGITQYRDGLTYNISEGAGATAFEVDINFTNVTSFNSIFVREYYQGSGAHEVQMYLWDYTANRWEDGYFNFNGQDDYQDTFVTIYDASNHLSAGNVRLKFNHSTTGIAGHNFFLDYVVLEQGLVTSASTGDGTGGWVTNGINTSTNLAVATSGVIYENGILLNTKYNDTVAIGGVANNVTALQTLASGSYSNITSLQTSNGTIWTNLSGKANLVGDNTFVGDNYFVGDVIIYNSTQTNYNTSFVVKDGTGTAKVNFNTTGNSYLNPGNIGINTTAPSYLLDVVGTVNAIRYLGDGSQLSNIATLTQLGAIYTNLSSIGNWSADKSNYATNSYVLGVGNWSTDRTAVFTNITALQSSNSSIWTQLANIYTNITNLQTSNATLSLLASGSYTNTTALQLLASGSYTNVTNLQTNMSQMNIMKNNINDTFLLNDSQINIRLNNLNSTLLSNDSQINTQINNLNATLQGKANTASPTFTGTVTIPNAVISTNMTLPVETSGALVCVVGDSNSCYIAQNTSCRVYYSPSSTTALKLADAGTVC